MARRREKAGNVGYDFFIDSFVCVDAPPGTDPDTLLGQAAEKLSQRVAEGDIDFCCERTVDHETGESKSIPGAAPLASEAIWNLYVDSRWSLCYMDRLLPELEKSLRGSIREIEKEFPELAERFNNGRSLSMIATGPPRKP